MAFKMKGFTPYGKSPMRQVEPTEPAFTVPDNTVEPWDLETPVDNTPPADNTNVVNDTEQNTSSTIPKYKGIVEELNAARKANNKYRKEGFLGKIQDKFQLGEKGIWGDKYQEKKRGKIDSYRLDKSIKKAEDDRFVTTPLAEGGGEPKKATYAELQELRKKIKLANKDEDPMNDEADWVVVGVQGNGIHPARMKDERGFPIRRTTWEDGYKQREYLIVPKEVYWSSENLQKRRSHYLNRKSGKPKSSIERDFGSEYLLDNPLD